MSRHLSPGLWFISESLGICPPHSPLTFLSITKSFSAAVRLLISSSYLVHREIYQVTLHPILPSKNLRSKWLKKAKHVIFQLHWARGITWNVFFFFVCMYFSFPFRNSEYQISAIIWQSRVVNSLDLIPEEEV